jgi:hypothetical protein
LAFDVGQNLSSPADEVGVGELNIQVVVHIQNNEDYIGSRRIGRVDLCGTSRGRDSGSRHVDEEKKKTKEWKRR